MNTFLTEKLNERALPKLRSRSEMLDLLLREEYGYLPPTPINMTFEVQENYIPNFCAGKADAKKIIANCVMGDKRFSFPFYAVIPVNEGKHPFFVHINFRDDIPDRYMPSEELVDNGFAVFSFCYKDITSDDEDFTNGLAGILYENGKREPTDAGKLSMWAWAAQRVMDYAYLNSGNLDLNCAIVCGHSRLGKTALLAAATDKRFKFAYSNDSGCSGAAIFRGKEGETAEKIYDVFPYWFCENFGKYGEGEREMSFDQHYLLASIAPRFVCVGSATKDAWADPVSEFLSCVAASKAFNKPLVCAERLPIVNDMWFEGDIGYHFREGLHYFGREDWLRLIEFIRLHQTIK